MWKNRTRWTNPLCSQFPLAAWAFLRVLSFSDCLGICANRSACFRLAPRVSPNCIARCSGSSAALLARGRICERDDLERAAAESLLATSLESIAQGIWPRSRIFSLAAAGRQIAASIFAIHGAGETSGIAIRLMGDRESP